jgi:hypothetical protein
MLHLDHSRVIMGGGDCVRSPELMAPFTRFRGRAGFGNSDA